MSHPGIFPTCLLCATLLTSAAQADPAAPEEGAQWQHAVARAQFTTGIRDREPVDQVVTLDNTDTRIFFFTELIGMEGHTVMHRWEYQGKVMAEVPFRIDGSRWRVYSSKTLNPDETGKWTVMIVDQSGWPLGAGMFLYQDAAKSASR